MRKEDMILCAVEGANPGRVKGRQTGAVIGVIEWQRSRCCIISEFEAYVTASWRLYSEAGCVLATEQLANAMSFVNPRRDRQPSVISGQNGAALVLESRVFRS